MTDYSDLIGKRVRIQGLVESGRTAFNGKTGTVDSRNPETGEYVVLLDVPLKVVPPLGESNTEIRLTTVHETVECRRGVVVLEDNLEPFKHIVPTKDAVNTDECSVCDFTAPVDTSLLVCSLCKNVCYCSQECQRRMWLRHKLKCKLYRRACQHLQQEKTGHFVGADSEAWRARADRSIAGLFEVFHQEGIQFIKLALEERSPSLRLRLDETHGLITVCFESYQDCDKALLKLQLAMPGRANLDIQLETVFRPSPSTGNSPISKYLQLPSEISYNPRSHAYIVVIVKKEKDSHEFQTGSACLPFQGDGAVGHYLSEKKQKAARASDNLHELKVKIERAEQYSECRQLLLKFRKKCHRMHGSHGVRLILICNMFIPGRPVFKYKQLPLVTPKVLSRALKDALAAKETEPNSPLLCLPVHAKVIATQYPAKSGLHLDRELWSTCTQSKISAHNGAVFLIGTTFHDLNGPRTIWESLFVSKNVNV